MGGDVDTFPEQQPWDGAVSGVRRRCGMDMGRTIFIGGDVSGTISAVSSDEGVSRGRESVRYCFLGYAAMHSRREGVSMNQYCVHLLSRNDALLSK